MRKKMLVMPLILLFMASLINLPQVKASPAAVEVSKVYNMTEIGKTFLANISVIDVNDLFMWYICIGWNSSVVQIATGDPNGLPWEIWYPSHAIIYYNVYEGGFMSSVREPAVFLITYVDNTRGQLNLTAGYLAQGTTPSGSGVLASINFTLINNATTILDINGAGAAGVSSLQDHNGLRIPHDDIDGLVTWEPPPVIPIWAELWFQATIVIVVIVGVAAAYFILRKRRYKPPIEGEIGPKKGKQGAQVTKSR